MKAFAIEAVEGEKSLDPGSFWAIWKIKIYFNKDLKSSNISIANIFIRKLKYGNRDTVSNEE